MRHSTHLLKASPRGLAGVLLGVLATLAFAVPSLAQLNGTYTIGGASPNYATVDAALIALNTGVSGPVTFKIRGGTYTAPSGGWRLANVAGLSATNTVTFMPDAGATVTLTGNTGLNQSGVFTMDGARYYIIEGSNVVGGSTKNMTILQTEANYNPAIYFKNNSDFNIVRNCILQSNGTSANTTYGYGTVYFGLTNTTSGNDSNTVRNCTIGDPGGVYRGYVGVGMYGQNTTYMNIGNRVLNNEIINFRIYGVWIDNYNSGPIIRKNTVRMTVAGTSSVAYGIYTNESSGIPLNSTIDSNKIYNLLPTITSSGSLYGIYSNTNAILTGTTQISNNMISMMLNGYVYFYPIYINSNTSTASTLTYNIYHNSVYTGGIATSFAQTMALYRYAYNSSGVGVANNVNHRNNIYYNARIGGTSTSYGLYVYASPVGGWTSNNNLIQLQTETSYYTAYFNFSLYQTLASYKTSGQDVNSVGANPQFVDPANGDLHIAAGKRTAVENAGTPVAGQTTDFDGQTRNATTPDIGADEGTFLAPLAIDASVDRIMSPVANATVRSGVTFTPVAMFSNIGTTTQTIPVRLRILNASNTVVYNDLQNFSVPGLTGQRVQFNATGNAGGSTNLVAGIYTMELKTELGTDGDASNNTYTQTIYVKDQLSGVYTINKLGSGLRNFTSFTGAITDLNALGAIGPVTFKVATGVYDSTTETFPLTIIPATGVNATNTITFKPDSLANVTLTKAHGTAVVDLQGADYITFDGSNTMAGARAFKVINSGGGPAIRFFDAAQFNTIRNMHLMASNTTTTGVLYIANRSAATVGNNDNVIQGNTIGDSAGVFRSFCDIYMAGDFTYRNSRNRIEGNDIINWGSTANGGGYGIYWNSYNDNMKVFGNNFTLTTTANTTGFSAVYGIYITNFYNANDTIAYNKFWNLSTLTTTTTQAGIWSSSPGQASPISIHNNMISLEATLGTIYGIYITSASPSVYNIEHNSVMIRGNNTTTSNYMSATFRMTSTANVTLRNNILANERTWNSGTNAYLIYRSTSGTLTSNYNDLWINGNGTAVGFNGSTNLITLANWQTVSDFNSIGNRPPFVNPVTGDLHINPQPVFAGEGQGMTLGYPQDFDRTARDVLAPDMGADDGDFNGGGLALLSPNTYNVYIPQEVVPVQFTANRPMSARVELTMDNGATWTPVATVNPTMKGLNTLNLNLPDAVTQAGRLRVVNTRNQYEFDYADTTFKIVRKLKLLKPNGGEQFHAGDTTYVGWERVPGDLIGQALSLEYSVDGGVMWNELITLIPAYMDSARWIVPDLPTSQGLVRVMSQELPKFWDSTNTPFTIVKGSLELTGPNGGEHYELAEPVTVNWNASYVNTVRLQYSSDNGVTWTTIANNLPGASGSHTFTPLEIPTRTARVRLQDVERLRVVDMSELPFEVGMSSTMTVFTPSAGDRLARNSTAMITWEAPEVNSINILYSSNGGATWQNVATNVIASEGSRAWTVPNQNTTQGKIRIVEVGGSGSAESGIFSIVDPLVPTITVRAPDGGEKFNEGETIAINWTASDVSMVDVHYSDNGGVTWNIVATHVPASQGTVNWVAPPKPGTNYLVRVRSLLPDASDKSNAPFEIAKRPQPRLFLLYPNGGETFSVDSTVRVQWTATDISGTVRLEWSTNNGATWDPVTSANAADGSYNWVVPDKPTKQGIMRITAVNLSMSDSSNGTFEVTLKSVPQLQVLTPNGDEQWKMGDKEMITWVEVSSIPALNIKFSTDGGQTWTLIEENVPMKPAAFEWTIPSLGTSGTGTALVKIESSTDSGQADISDRPFSISQQIAGVGGAVTGNAVLSGLGNYPNPFSEATELRWRQGVGGMVEVRIYQPNGVLVRSENLGHREAGDQQYVINRGELTSGLYLYEVRLAREVARGIMSVVK